MRFQTFAAALVLIVLVAAWLNDGSSEDRSADAPAPSLTALPADADLLCQVAYVHDGDSLRCRDGTRIRLHAVAAREKDEACSPGHPCPAASAASAASATRTLKQLAQGRDLACRATGRSYDRVTAICWTPEGTEVNCAMIRSGTALTWPRYNRQTPICA